MKDEPVSRSISNAKATTDERFYPLVGDVLQEGNRTKVQGKERRSAEVKRERPRGAKGAK